MDDLFLLVFSQNNTSGQYSPSLSDDVGYVRLDNGLIIQYGMSGPYNIETRYKITFPIEFPHKIFSISLTDETRNADIDNSNDWWQVVSYDTKSMIVNLQAADYHRDNQYLHWFAIGY